jgi:hypothetical protein
MFSNDKTIVSSHGQDSGELVFRKPPARTPASPGSLAAAQKQFNPDWKKACKSVEKEENPKKGPRRSWARNHTGNIN